MFKRTIISLTTCRRSFSRISFVRRQLTLVTSSITSVLISRFLIDLRKVAQQQDRPDSTSVYLTTGIRGPSMWTTDTFGVGDLGGAVGSSFMSPVTSDYSSCPDTVNDFVEAHELQVKCEDDTGSLPSHLTDRVCP